MGRTSTVKPQYYCVKCGRHKDKREFSLNYNKRLQEYNDGRMLYCNSCCKEISQSIMGEYWSPSKNRDDSLAYSLGIRAICVFFLLPYTNEAMSKVREKELNSTKERDWNYVFQYMLTLDELSVPRSYWNNLSGNSFLSLDLLNEAKATQDGDLELFEDLEKDWGIQDSLEDYLFLEDKFKEYTSGETLSVTMVNLIRYLCQAELDVMKLKRQKAEIKDINVAEKRVTDYYSKLKLDDFKFNKSKTKQEMLIEDWGYIHENVEPLDWEDDNLKDRLGFEQDYDDIMRSMGNKILGSKEYPTITLEDVKKKGRGKKK